MNYCEIKFYTVQRIELALKTFQNNPISYAYPKQISSPLKYAMKNEGSGFFYLVHILKFILILAIKVSVCGSKNKNCIQKGIQLFVLKIFEYEYEYFILKFREYEYFIFKILEYEYESEYFIFKFLEYEYRKNPYSNTKVFEYGCIRSTSGSLGL